MGVRRARSGDLPEIVRLWRRMWDLHTPLDARFQATPAAEAVMSGWIEDQMHRERAAVLVEEEPPGALEGYCLAVILENPPVLPWQFYGHISEISVRRPGRGVGTKLLEAAHAWLRENRVPYVEVSVSVRNISARRFWRKQGYTEFLERLRLNLAPRSSP